MPPSTYDVQPVAHVRSPLVDREDAPPQGDEGAPDAVLDVKPVLDPGAER